MVSEHLLDFCRARNSAAGAPDSCALCPLASLQFQSAGRGTLGLRHQRAAELQRPPVCPACGGQARQPRETPPGCSRWLRTRPHPRARVRVRGGQPAAARKRAVCPLDLPPAHHWRAHPWDGRLARAAGAASATRFSPAAPHTADATSGFGSGS
jgi:hypothetical protein